MIEALEIQIQIVTRLLNSDSGSDSDSNSGLDLDSTNPPIQPLLWRQIQQTRRTIHYCMKLFNYQYYFKANVNVSMKV